MSTPLIFLFALAHISVCLGVFADINMEGQAMAAMANALPGLAARGKRTPTQKAISGDDGYFSILLTSITFS